MIGITGASGHIGHNILKKLIDDGHQVKVLIHNRDIHFSNSKIIKCKGDLSDPVSLTDFCDGLDIIIHLAAVISIGNYSDKILYDTNIHGTKNLIIAARNKNVRRFIHFSSIHALIHEPLDIEMDENRELALNSHIVYERTKAIAEKWVLEQNSNDFHIIIISPTSVIGPEDLAYKRVIPGVVKGGYDWVDVRDVVDATINSIKNGKAGKRYILSGSWYTLKDLSDMFLAASDKPHRMAVIPLWLAKAGIPFLSIYSKITGILPIYTKETLYILQHGNRKISNALARKELGFNPRPLSQTLKDTYQWFKKERYI